MKTFTQLRNTTAQYCNVNTSDTAKMALIDKNINDSIRTMCNLHGGKLRFLEDTHDMYTIAGIEEYQIPNKFRKLIDMWVYSGADPSATGTNVIYTPEMVFDPTRWKKILQARFGSQDVPYFTYVEGTKFFMQPVPQTDGQLIRLRGRLTTRDLTIADYTTGTIVSVPLTTTFTAVVAADAVSATLSGAWALTTGVYQVTFSNGDIRLVTLTNGATTATWENGLSAAATATITVGTASGGSIVTGSGTTFTADMVGRYIQITNTTAANGGDGFWYRIGYYYSATVIGLDKQYEGLAISAGSATYTIGQCSAIPEAYDVGIVYRATALWWDNNGDLARGKSYWLKYDGGNEAGYSQAYGGLVSQMIVTEGETEEGSYIPPFASGSATQQGAPYYFPYQDASGF
jgi:hypothetical protein